MELLWIDTETGGLDERMYSLLEVALLAVRNHDVIGEYHAFVRQNPYHVEPEAMKVNGLDLDRVYELGKWPAHVVHEIQFFVWTHFRSQPVLAGHNVHFDQRWIQHLFEQHGQDFSALYSYRRLDTASLLYALYDMGRIPFSAVSLSGACEVFGLGKVSHRALADCRQAFRVYERVLEEFRKSADQWTA